MKKLLLFTCGLAIAAAVEAQIIHVPAEYPTIQQAIDFSSDGDTILVAPGTYIENINFYGKSITVASLYLTTLDTAYISQTIIDGNHTGSVVNFSNGEDSTTLLSGFVIMNGYSGLGAGIYISNTNPMLDHLTIKDNTAYAWWGGGSGGGIYCNCSSSRMQNLTIKDNHAYYGGGIYCYGSNLVLQNVTISNNTAMYYGGGIYFFFSSPILENVSIVNNNAYYGGGIYSDTDSNPSMENVTVRYNSADVGGGIYFNESNPVFSSVNRCNIYLNMANTGNDLYSNYNTNTEIVVDTFTVLIPTGLFAYPLENFSFDILHGKIEQVEADLYVSPFGDDENSGLVPDDPLKTIHCASLKIVADSLHPRTIHLLEGTFSPSVSGELYPVHLQNFVSLSGISETGVILDAEAQSSVIRILNNAGSGILNLTITGGLTSGSGGGIYCTNSSPVIQNVTITDNHAYSGGGIYCNASNPAFENVKLSFNTADYGGGGIYTDGSPVLQNVTIDNNHAGYGGGIYCDYYSNPVIQNVSITNNYAGSGGGIYCYYNSSPAFENITVAYNSADDGGGGIYFYYCNPVFDSINRCNIYLNAAPAGNDLYSDYYLIEVILDTFSVINPTEFFAYPLENFNFDILHGKIDQVEADLYVSPFGDNANSGLTSNDPLKTIRYAILKIFADSLHPHTIYLLDGTYSPSTNGEDFPAYVPSYVSLSGASETGVILDAEGLTRVIGISNNLETEISNLTITGGATSSSGGGILCNNSNPLLHDITLTNNEAGIGGGIYCSYNSGPILQNMIITGNHADEGGGIYCDDYSNPVFENVTVAYNSADYNGGGLYFYYSSPFFDSINRCNIYLNNATYGDDLYSNSYYSNLTIEVIVDTFTVLYPRSFQAYPLTSFSFDILHGLIPQLNLELYASPEGDNSNSGLTSDDPLKTISYALSLISQDSINYYTLQLLDGIYSPSTNQEVFPISIPEYVNLTGESETGVVLDAENQAGVIEIGGEYITISNLTITGGLAPYSGGGIYCGDYSPVLQHVIITNNSAGSGGGIFCSTSPVLQNITISGNHAGSGGGIFCDYNSNPDLDNVYITNNSADNEGGGIYCRWSSPIIQNLVITGNHAGSGGGIYCAYTSNPILKNISLSYNSADYSGGGIYFYGNVSPVFDSIDRCSIYLNDAATGDDLYSDYFIEVIVDTFTVLYPRSFQAYPLINFSFDILHGLIPQSNLNLYASPDGDNSNSGLTSDDPLKTIFFAMSVAAQDPINFYTIQLLEGIYSASNNQESFPVYLPEYLGLAGESESGVILNAEHQTGVIELIGQNATISNLTVTGGTNELDGGGINCSGFSAIIQNVTVTDNQANYGGGIYTDGSLNLVLQDLTLSYNSAGHRGGGIYINDSDPVLQNVEIYGNHADDGGGIYCLYDANPVLENVTVYDNTAQVGGGFYFMSGVPLFDSINRCNIYLNNAIAGSDLYSESFIEVVVDTFTILTPNPYYAYPFQNFSFDILHGKLQLVDADLYVSPEGSNSNSGLTPDDPLKTIRFASSVISTSSLNPHTIYLTEGVYSPSITEEFFPVFVPDYCNLSGEVASTVLLDGEGSVVLYLNGNDHSTISGMTIKGGGSVNNPFNLRGGIYCDYSSLLLENLIITDNDKEGIYLNNSSPVIKNVVIHNNGGSGIYCINSNPLMMNIMLKNNQGSSGTGGGLNLFQSSPVLYNVNIYENQASKGGGIFCYGSSPLILNSTISANMSSFGGGAYAGAGSDIEIVNSIIWDNLPHEVMIQGVYSANSAEIAFSDIKGGEEGVVLSGNCTLSWLEGNIDEDPVFTGTGDHPYALSDGSPCIDAGTPDTTGLNLPYGDIIGNKRIWDGDLNGIAIVDMGAYEYASIPVGLEKHHVQLLEVTCFPNPFSSSATIKYKLEENASVNLIILNHLGQEVDVLVKEQQTIGTQMVQWNAIDFPAGIYYYHIRAGNTVNAGKMVLVK